MKFFLKAVLVTGIVSVATGLTIAYLTDRAVKKATHQL